MASQTVLCLSTLFTNCKTPLTESEKIFSFQGSTFTLGLEKQFFKNTQTKFKAEEFMLTLILWEIEGLVSTCDQGEHLQVMLE